MREELIKKAISIAKRTRELAYTPYSNFKVGAAVVTKEGTIYSGCNIENASYGLTICAERVAIFKAISEGERDFDFLVIVTDTQNPTTPCGACRQVMREFGQTLEIIITNLKGDEKRMTLSQLLPDSFGPEDLT